MFEDLPLMPEQATDHAQHVDALFFSLLGLAICISSVIATLVIVFCVKYRRRSDADQPGVVKPALALELTWTLTPFAISLGIFAWGASLFFRANRPPDDALEVYMVGKQWMWKTQHVSGPREINELHVPVGRPVKVTL